MKNKNEENKMIKMKKFLLLLMFGTFFINDAKSCLDLSSITKQDVYEILSKATTMEAHSTSITLSTGKNVVAFYKFYKIKPEPTEEELSDLKITREDEDEDTTPVLFPDLHGCFYDIKKGEEVIGQVKIKRLQK